jgi:general secretion pathway protein A
VQTYKDSVITLKLLLQDLGFKNVTIDDQYDNFTQEAVEAIQAKYGIPVDGYVGPLTKIVLYKEKDSSEMPHLTNLGRE